MTTRQLGRNRANKQLACRKRFVTKRKIITKLCKSDYAEKDSCNRRLNTDGNFCSFQLVAQPIKLFFLSRWLTRGPDLPPPCLRWAPLAPHLYVYLFFQTRVSSTESTKVRVQIRLTELLLDGLPKS